MPEGCVVVALGGRRPRAMEEHRDVTRGGSASPAGCRPASTGRRLLRTIRATFLLTREDT